MANHTPKTSFLADANLSRALLETILAHGPVGFAFLDRECRCVHVNERLAEIDGLPVEEHIGRSAEELLGDLWEGRRPYIEKALAGEATVDVSLPAVGSNPATALRQAVASFLPVRNDSETSQIVGVAVIVKDVTEQSAAEAKLTRQSLAFENLFDALVITDAQGIMQDCNASFERRSGYLRQELIGRSVTELSPPEIAQAMLPTIIAGIRADGRWLGELQYVNRAGEVRIAETAAIAVRGPDGGIISLVGALRDITERKRSEAALRESEERYRRTAEELASAYTRERVVNQIGQTIRQSLDPEVIQQTALTALGEALGCDRCYFATHEGFRVTIGRDYAGSGLHSVAGEYKPTDFQAMSDDVFMRGPTVVFRSVRTEASVAARGYFERVPMQSCVCVQMVGTGTTASALFAGMSATEREWTPDEVTLAESVAVMLRAAVETARANLRERTIARRLQESLHPRLPRYAPGLRLADYYKPALAEAEVGGDFADCFAVQKDVTCLVVCDLSGKGLAAAAQVATLRHMLRFAVYGGDSLHECVGRLNRTLCQFSLLAGFATLFVGTYDARTRELRYTNCGQEPGLIYRKATGAVEHLTTTGPVLGTIELAEFGERTVLLGDGDVLALFTDGLTETGVNRAELLGVAGVADLLSKHAHADLHAESLVIKVVADVSAYAHGALRDDVCLLIAIAEQQP